MLYQIHGGTVSICGTVLFDKIDFEIRGRERVAIVGENGCGKTTLLRVIAGELELDRDDHMGRGVITTASPVTIGYLKQNVFQDMEVTVDEELKAACPDPEEFTKERFFYEAEYDRIFTGFGFAKADKKKRLGEFSGGEQIKIALIRLLLEKPDILVLDEPTNHLDMQTVEWLEDYLKEYEKAVIVVSHDRYFLDEVATVIYEAEQKKLVRYAGNYTSYRKEKETCLEQRQKAYDRYVEEEARLTALIERFKGKSGKAAMARAKKKQLERLKPAEKPNLTEKKMFLRTLTPEIPGGKQVLTVSKLKFGYESPLADEFSIKIHRGQKIGIIGENGAGKSTLLKTLAERIPPISGHIDLGFQVEMGYFDQQTAAAQKDLSVIDSFKQDYPMLTEKEARNVLAAFLFTGKEVNKRLSVLSGGEKVRLALAKLCYRCPNLLLLDEPTNHLDIWGKEAVEEMLLAYGGTLLFVSHDRYFLSRVADSLLIFEQDGVHYYPFGYRHYRERCERWGSTVLSHLEKMDRMQREQERLSEELKAVPKPERHRLREIPEEEAFDEWRLRLIEEEMDQLTDRLLELEERLVAVEYRYAAYFGKEAERLCVEEEKEILTAELTGLCIRWAFERNENE